jgi:DNA primase
MPGIDFREARARLPLAAVLQLLGFVPRARAGDQVRGPCPMHGSRSPSSRSFAAHLGRGVWHCFRCGAGGNALDLGVALTRQPLHAAVRDLCARLGRDVPWLPRPRAAQPMPRAGAHEEEKNTMHDP